MLVRQRALTVLELVGVGLLGALLAVLVAGTVTRDVGPFTAEMSFALSFHGGTRVDVPPLGRLDLDTHNGPVLLDVGVTSLRPDAARAIAKDPQQLRGIGKRVDADLRAGLKELVLRTVALTVLGAALLGLLVFRRRLRRVLAAVGAGVGALAAVGALTALTVDARALAQPRYTGLLASAPTAVGDVRDILADVDAYGLQLGKLVTGVTRLYAVTTALPVFTPTDDTIRALHVSDLHLNPTTYGILGSVVKQFGIDVVIDTGDSTDLGTVPETRYVDEIRRLPVPYVWIRGNHDSRKVQLAVARQPNATVLDGPQVVEVAGLRFLGQGDPRFIRDEETRGKAPPEVLTVVGQQLADAYKAAVDPPDLVLSHDPATTGPLMGVAPVVLAGHTHKRRTETVDGTTLLVQGSTGGAGLRALRGEDPTPVTMTVLYLDRTTGQLQAYDDITLGGVGASEASIRRRLVAEPRPEPAPSPSGR